MALEYGETAVVSDKDKREDADAEDAAAETAATEQSDIVSDPAPSDGPTDLDGAADGDAGRGDAADAAEEPYADRSHDVYATADDTVAKEPAPVSPATTPAAQPSGSRGGFFPALLGGVVAGGLGFGAAGYMGGDLFGGGGGADPLESALGAQAEQIAALETQIGEIAAQLSAPREDTTGPQLAALGEQLEGRFGDVAGQLESLAGSLGTVDTRIGDVASQLGGVEERLGQVDERLITVEKRPLVESSETARAAFQVYEQELEDLRASLAEQSDRNAEMSAEMSALAEQARQEIEAARSAAQSEITEVESRAGSLQEEAEARLRDLAQREALASLSAAIARGDGYENALQVVSEYAEVPEALSANAAGGIASMADLRESYPAAARDALAASIRETVDAEDAKPADRLAAFLRTQTGARSLEPYEGTNPDAVLARAEAALNAGDLATVLSELQSLPEAGRGAMGDWIQRAETRQAVRAAADALSAQINAE